MLLPLLIKTCLTGVSNFLYLYTRIIDSRDISCPLTGCLLELFVHQNKTSFVYGSRLDVDSKEDIDSGAAGFTNLFVKTIEPSKKGPSTLSKLI